MNYSKPNMQYLSPVNILIFVDLSQTTQTQQDQAKTNLF